MEAFRFGFSFGSRPSCKTEQRTQNGGFDNGCACTKVDHTILFTSFSQDDRLRTPYVWPALVAVLVRSGSRWLTNLL